MVKVYTKYDPMPNLIRVAKDIYGGYYEYRATKVVEGLEGVVFVVYECGG